MNIDRISIIQKIVDKMRAKVYVEIGIRDGSCFLRIKAPNKIAVDPVMAIPSKVKRRYYFKYYRNLFNRYYEMTSDDFFHKHDALLKQVGVDVVFVDGLHTYEQSLKDVRNSLVYLRDNGVIVMHDCNPLSEAAASPAASFEHAVQMGIPGFTGEWNGDVWKTILYLRSYRKDLDVFVLDCDYGVGIVRRKRAEQILSYSPEEILTLSYDDLDKNRKIFLNLKDPIYLNEFLKDL